MSDENNMNSAIRWWEKKRWIYNVLVFGVGLTMLIIRQDYLQSGSFLFSFLLLLFWMFGANIFYTLGWAAEVLFNYYFKWSFWENNLRWLFYTGGLTFSMFWIFILISNVI